MKLCWVSTSVSMWVIQVSQKELIIEMKAIATRSGKGELAKRREPTKILDFQAGKNKRSSYPKCREENRQERHQMYFPRH